MFICIFFLTCIFLYSFTRTDTHAQRKKKDTLDCLLSKFEFIGETEKAKLTAEETKLLLREACKKTKLE